MLAYDDFTACRQIFTLRAKRQGFIIRMICRQPARADISRSWRHVIALADMLMRLNGDTPIEPRDSWRHGVHDDISLFHGAYRGLDAAK